MYIVMLGAPGTGKGTIGKILSKDMNLTHISTGDIFREQLEKKTVLGKKLESYMSKGLLVPDDVVIETIKSRLLEEDVKNGAILDGFPRTAVQAQALRDFLINYNPEQKRIAIELTIPDEEIIKRVTNRVTCSNKKCGAIYNLETKKPKVSGVCDICGSNLSKRNDDNEETVKKRLEIYHSNSKELLEFYKKNNVLYTAYSKKLEETVENIKQYLKSK